MIYMIYLIYLIIYLIYLIYLTIYLIYLIWSGILALRVRRGDCCHCSHYIQQQRQKQNRLTLYRVLSPRPNLQSKHSCGSDSPGTSRTSPCLRRSGRLLRGPSRRGKRRSPIARTIPARGRNKTKTHLSPRSRSVGRAGRQRQCLRCALHDALCTFGLRSTRSGRQCGV